MEINTISQPVNNQKAVGDIVKKDPIAASGVDGNPVRQSSVVPVQQDVRTKVDSNLLDSINQQLVLAGTGLAFSYDETTSSSIIKVVDRKTDEVIKQFPSEDSLRIIENIQNYLSQVNGQPNGANASDDLTDVLFSEII